MQPGLFMYISTPDIISVVYFFPRWDSPQSWPFCWQSPVGSSISLLARSMGLLIGNTSIYSQFDRSYNIDRTVKALQKFSMLNNFQLCYYYSIFDHMIYFQVSTSAQPKSQLWGSTSLYPRDCLPKVYSASILDQALHWSKTTPDWAWF